MKKKKTKTTQNTIICMLPIVMQHAILGAVSKFVVHFLCRTGQMLVLDF